MKRRIFVLALLLLAFAVLAWNYSKTNKTNNVGIPNPAAVYCTQLGYSYKVVNTEKGQVRYCILPDGSSCEAWQLFKGKCGRKLQLLGRRCKHYAL